MYNSKDELLNEKTAPADMGTYNYSPFIEGEDGEEKHAKDDVYTYFRCFNTLENRVSTFNGLEYKEEKKRIGYSDFR